MEDNWWEGFYKKPLLWGLAWILVLAMWLSVVSFPPMVRIGGMTVSWDEAQRAVQMSGSDQKLNIFGVGMHLTPFGLQYSTYSTDMGGRFGTISNSLQGNLFVGLLALFVSILFVGLIARNSNDCVYVVGPFVAYSILAVFWMTAVIAPHNSSHFVNAGGLIVQVVVYSMIAGVIAKAILMSVHNSGLIELEEGGDFSSLSSDVVDATRHAAQLRISRVVLPSTNSDENKSSVSSSDATQSQPTQPSLFHEDDAVPTTAVVEEVRQTVKLVAESLVLMVAYYCPFCGRAMKKFARSGVKPWICGNCRLILAPTFRESEEKLCSNCKGHLLDSPSAVYCHHCGWQIGVERATLPGDGGVGI